MKNKILFTLMVIIGMISISACTQMTTEQGKPLSIVVKDIGFPEVKYLQPTINEIQLKGQNGNWVTIWSNSEGKTVKLTPDGAEILLDEVNVAAGTYTATRLLVSSVDVEADVNRDGDTEDKIVEIVLTIDDFSELPEGDRSSCSATTPEKPSAPEQPSAPDAPDKPDAPEGGDSPPGEEPEKPSAPEEPKAPDMEEPSKPSEPEEPSDPSEPTVPSCLKVENGLVHMNQFLDEVHTAVPEGYITPLFSKDFVYSGSGGRIVYDFTLQPFKPIHEQIKVEVSVLE